jgi:hypothetical protein
MAPTSEERDYESHCIKPPYAQRFIVHIQQSDDTDALGFPSSVELEDISRPHEGMREYVPRNLALLVESESGRVYCSCCGRELKRKYKFSPSWRFCPRCGAEVLR